MADLLNSLQESKKQAILMTIYSARLRIAEDINQRIADIDYKRMQIRIKQRNRRPPEAKKTATTYSP